MTKHQLSKMWEQENEFPFTRANDDPMLSKESSVSNDGKPSVSSSLPITDAEYKKVIKLLYGQPKKNKFKRQ